MSNPSQSEIWSQLFVSAAGLREGDLASIGQLDETLERLFASGASVAAEPIRKVLGELIAEFDHFLELVGGVDVQ